MKKRFISMILVLLIILTSFTPVLAGGKGDYLQDAEKLKPLGIFIGNNGDFQLERQATRIEGLVMLIRLLGKEEDARESMNEPSPFTDVPEWAKAYVDYAYKTGLTKGVSKDLFGSKRNVDAKIYLTFMLRALGYDDSKGDFAYEEAVNFAKEIELLTAEDVKEIGSNVFLRDHVAKISMLTLQTNIKDQSMTLLEKLVAEGVILKSLAEEIVKIDDFDLEVHFIDVGQADSILIKKGNESMLIDAGNNWDGERVVDYIKGQGIKKLKYIIGTHPHADHIGGLDDVIDAFDIGTIIMPNKISTTKTFEDVLDSIARKGLSITKPKPGQTYDLNGAEVIILGPVEEKYSNINNYSVVAKLVNGKNTFLFTGDAEAMSEREMLDKNKEILKSDLLKSGHHGSDTSTSQDFLDAVNPKYAVITVGIDNRYGHPDTVVLDRLEMKKVQVYRTDLDGTIIAISDGDIISFTKEIDGNN